MARSDIVGFFWNDEPPPKPPKKEKPKAVPPDPVWLLPTYLPGLDEARAMRPDLFTDGELVIAAAKGERLVWDIECYPNYFLVAFKSISTGKIVYFESGEGMTLDIAKLAWVLRAFTIVDYNGNRYDVPIVSIALAGHNTQTLWDATSLIINSKKDERLSINKLLKQFKATKVQVNHIDLIELVALKPSLKLLAGRLHARRMQDLPFAPGSVLSPDQIVITRWYCLNDLDNTESLYNELLPDIKLREKMSDRYGVDLRSHSDAQIAETVITSEIKKITRQKYLTRPKFDPDKTYRYKVPAFIKYESALPNWVLDVVKGSTFALKPSGKIIMPDEIKALKIQIADAVYKMGIGGLHSTEKKATHYADANYLLCDRDVASYYPRIILNCLLAPLHLGPPFLKVYSAIVIERLFAKETGDEVAANGLKIVVNGSFGKLGNMYSGLYSPDLLIQVTITGQLALLMLIERLELAGFRIVSANTDGIIIKCDRTRQGEMDAIVAQWEKDTAFETEATYYKAVHSRDVNNYFAVKETGQKPKSKYLDERLGVKVKGVFSERGSSRNSILAKNPQAMICSDAVQIFLTTGKPVEQTIRECRDVRRFVSVRTVRGGAVKSGEYLGKAIRWYYAAGETGEIVYAKSGNKVPRSEGAKPCMLLPDVFPDDIDYSWYEKEATKIMYQIGLLKESPVAEDEDDEDEEEAEVEEDEIEYCG